MSYLNRNDRGSTAIEHEVYDWKQTSLTIDDQDAFIEYEVSVLARNKVGDSKGRLDPMIGYSGEDSKLGLKIMFLEVTCQ